MSGGAPTRIVIFPAWQDNPYLNLLHLATGGAGYWLDRVKTMEDALAAIAEDPADTILHMNWTSPICQETPDPLEARERVDAFVGGLERATEAGLRIIWTVHNAMPHDAIHRDLELELHEALARLAHAIHVINPATPEVVAEHYALPADRIRCIPHSSYQGVYGSPIPRDRARARFGLAPDELAVLFLGQLRPYKGVLDLLEAASEAQRMRGGRVVLMLAGKVRADEVAALDAAMPLDVRVIRSFRFVPDGETAWWFGAADLVALPYRNILNSGSMLLAQTFGAPVLLPDEPHVVSHHGDETWVRLYDRTRPVEALAEAIAAAPIDDEQAREAAFDAARAWSPYRMSRAFLALVREVQAGREERVSAA
ncbi:glycosyltransferase [Agrococcus carbonis]|uniref:Uncharacterized protein n=1 Tax=Agrococcus carbonis TaxID=684552 RepID=A0A1H1M4K5_9MICO|nr:glycosyltransferase [Agrococcus carbonis]SDR81748.1 hypothetical protein SAMN04489719_0864 [Agrococcus carbonis]